MPREAQAEAGPLAPGLVAPAEEEPGLAGHRQEREAYALLGHRYEPSVVGRSAVPPGAADAPGSLQKRSIRQLQPLQGRPPARAESQVAVAPFRAAAEPFRPVLFQIGVEPYPPVLSQAVLLQDAAEPAPALKSHLSPLSPHRSGAVA